MVADGRSHAIKSGNLVGFIALILCSFSLSIGSANAFEFKEFPAGKAYRGKPVAPDFKRRDKDFAFFKTRITNEMKEGVTFAGEYSVLQFGCGTGCTNVVVANNRTGQLYDFPRGGEFNQALTLGFQLNSNLMLARWYTDSLWETCVIEAFVFEEGKWIAKEALAGKGEEICEGDVAAGAANARDY